MQIRVKKLSAEAFDKYGKYLDLPTDEVAAFVTAGFGNFWRTDLEFPVKGGEMEIGVCTVKRRDYVIEEMERHLDTVEVFIPVGKDLVFTVALSRALDDPNDVPYPEDVSAFYLKKDQMIIINKGVWHYAPFAVGDDEKASALVFFKKNTPTDDTRFTKVFKSERIHIET